MFVVVVTDELDSINFPVEGNIALVTDAAHYLTITIKQINNMIKLTNNVSTNKIAYIPTKLNEISADFLKTITKTINLNNYQCLVALVTKTKLFDFAAYIGNPNTSREFSVTPILAKINNTADLPISVEVGNKIITSRTEIERGVHISVPTMCSSTRLSAFIQEDKELFKKILTGQLMDEKGVNIAQMTIYIVEFKILPVNAIYAAVNASFTKYVTTNDIFQESIGGNNGADITESDAVTGVNPRPNRTPGSEEGTTEGTIEGTTTPTEPTESTKPATPTDCDTDTPLH